MGDKYEHIWKDVWDQVKTYENVGVDQVNAFFSRLQPQAFSEGFLMLTADNDFIKRWIEKNYLQVIKQALQDIYNTPFEVAIEVDPDQSVGQQIPQPVVQTPQPESNALVLPTPVEATPNVNNAPNQQDDTFTSEYSFESFVVGSSNQLAYSMALAVAESPGKDITLNPLFIYGKSGLGKTHLLRAIQNYVSSTYPYMNTIYIDTMELVNNYTEASRSRDFATFRKPFDNADMIFIDDVQGLQGKEGTVNIVFQIINDMKDHGKQIVLSADRAPKHIDIDERYQTRFNSGGTCDIQPPELETKLGIIRNFIDDRRMKGTLAFDISPEIQNYIAQNSSSNIRELKSAITKVIFYAQSMHLSTISVDDVSRILKDHFSGGSMRRLTVQDIQKAVEQYFNISHADLVGNKRSANIAHARQIAIYLCRTMIDIPFASIGKEFNRDHTTVMYSVTTIEEKKRESRELNEELEIIQQIILE